MTDAPSSRPRPVDPFERLIEEHLPALTRLAGGYADDGGDRDDLVQEILVALWGALKRFRGECSERTFVFRVAHNQCLAHLRRRRRHRPLADALGVRDPAPDPAARAEREERHARLLAAIRRLNPIHRESVMLHLEGLSHREIGEVVGATENNVGVRLNRARAELRRLLGERGGDDDDA